MLTPEMISHLDQNLFETDHRFLISFPVVNDEVPKTVFVLGYEEMKTKEGKTFKLYRFKDDGGVMSCPYFNWTAMSPEAAIERLLLNAEDNGIKVEKIEAVEKSFPKPNAPGSTSIM